MNKLMVNFVAFDDQFEYGTQIPHVFIRCVLLLVFAFYLLLNMYYGSCVNHVVLIVLYVIYLWK